MSAGGAGVAPAAEAQQAEPHVQVNNGGDESQLDEVQKLQKELDASLEKVKSLAALAEERQAKIQMLEIQLDEANKGRSNAPATDSDDPAKGGVQEELSAANLRIEKQESRIKVLETELQELRGKSASGEDGEEGSGNAQAGGSDPSASLSDWANKDGVSPADAEALAKKYAELEEKNAAAESTNAKLQADLDRVSAKAEASAALLEEKQNEMQAKLEELAAVTADLANATQLVASLESDKAQALKELEERTDALSSLAEKEAELQDALDASKKHLSATDEKFRAEAERATALTAEVAEKNEKLQKAELRVESSAGDALANVAEMEVKLAQSSLEIETLRQDLEIMRARGSVVESQRLELEQMKEKLESSKKQQDSLKAEMNGLQAQLKEAQDELQKERDSMSSLTKRGSAASSRTNARTPQPAQKGSVSKGGTFSSRNLGRKVQGSDEGADEVEGSKAKASEQEESETIEKEEDGDVLGVLPAFEAAMLNMMKTSEEQMTSMIERLGLRVDAASSKVKNQEEVIKEVKQAKPRLLVQLQGMAQRLHNSEERNKALRVEVASLVKRIQSYEEEANLARDRNALLDAQLQSSMSDCEQIRQEALVTERVTRELHRQLAPQESIEELFFRFSTASNAWEDVPSPKERLRPGSAAAQRLTINTSLSPPTSPPATGRGPRSPLSPDVHTRTLIDNAVFTRSRVAAQPDAQRPSTARPRFSSAVASPPSYYTYSLSPSTPPQRPSTARARAQTPPGTSSRPVSPWSEISVASGSNWSSMMNRHVQDQHVPVMHRKAGYVHKMHEALCYDEAMKDTTPHPFLRRSMTTRGSSWRMAEIFHQKK